MGRPGQGGLVQRDAPPCRRRKVRSAPFPCTAKTAPAPLHPKGTSAPTPWAWALLLSPPCGARRDPLSVLPKEKRAVHGPKRKALARSGAVALRATGVGGSVQAPILACLRARFSLLQVCNCRPVADGAEVVGVVIALSLLLFSLPLAVPRGNWCNGRMWTSARKHKPLRPPG